MYANRFYSYQVIIDGAQCTLVTPMPIFSLEQTDDSPLTCEELLTGEGGYAYLLVHLPDGKQVRIVNHPYELLLDQPAQRALKW